MSGHLHWYLRDLLLLWNLLFFPLSPTQTQKLPGSQQSLLLITFSLYYQSLTLFDTTVRPNCMPLAYNASNAILWPSPAMSPAQSNSTSPAVLQRLKQGPKINIFWSLTPDDRETRGMLCEPVHKSILANFSSVLKESFTKPNIPTHHTKCYLRHVISNPYGEIAAIVSDYPRKGDLLKAIKWMVNSCTGSGPAHVEADSFIELLWMKQVCEAFDIPILLGFIHTRLHNFTRSQIPLQQIRAFYLEPVLAADKDNRELVVKSIGQAWYMDYLEDAELYQQYGKEENDLFLQGVQKYIDDRQPRSKTSQGEHKKNGEKDDAKPKGYQGKNWKPKSERKPKAEMDVKDRKQFPKLGSVDKKDARDGSEQSGPKTYEDIVAQAVRKEQKRQFFKEKYRKQPAAS